MCLRYCESIESDTGSLCYNRAAILILNQMTNAQYHHSIVISQEAAAIPICKRTCLSILSAGTMSSLLSISADLSSANCSQSGSLQQVLHWLSIHKGKTCPGPTPTLYRLLIQALLFTPLFHCTLLLPRSSPKDSFTEQEGPIFLVCSPLSLLLSGTTG